MLTAALILSLYLNAGLAWYVYAVRRVTETAIPFEVRTILTWPLALFVLLVVHWQEWRLRAAMKRVLKRLAPRE